MSEMWKAASKRWQSELAQKLPSESRLWNLWHGCHKKSEGCQHCYVFRRDAEFEKDSNVVTKTASFNLPVRRDRSGNWKVPSGTLMWTCFTSDFFIEDADEWREEAWMMIQRRSDLNFYIVTKRAERVRQSLPEDWGEGYENVTICCTMENQRRTDERLQYRIPDGTNCKKSSIINSLYESTTIKRKCQQERQHLHGTHRDCQQIREK